MGTTNPKATIQQGALPPGGAPGQVIVKNSGTDGDAGWGSATGTGNVVGPASAVDGEIALYNGTTGKTLKRGVAPSALPVSTAQQVAIDAKVQDSMEASASVAPSVNAVAAAIAAVGGGGGAAGPATPIAYSNHIDLTRVGGSTMGIRTLRTNTVFDVLAGAVAEGNCNLILVSDGTHTADVDTNFNNINGYELPIPAGQSALFSFFQDDSGANQVIGGNGGTKSILASAQVPNSAPGTMVFTLTENYAGALPAASAFTGHVNGVPWTGSAITGSTNTVTVTMGGVVAAGGQSLDATYTKPVTNPLTGASGRVFLAEPFIAALNNVVASGVLTLTAASPVDENLTASAYLDYYCPMKSYPGYNDVRKGGANVIQYAASLTNCSRIADGGSGGDSAFNWTDSAPGPNGLGTNTPSGNNNRENALWTPTSTASPSYVDHIIPVDTTLRPGFIEIGLYTSASNNGVSRIRLTLSDGSAAEQVLTLPQTSGSYVVKRYNFTVKAGLPTGVTLRVRHEIDAGGTIGFNQSAIAIH